MEGLTLSEIFTLIAAGASVAIAAVAIGLSVVYFLLANRLFRKTEETVGEIENSVNQMYGALTKLSKRSESSAAEIEGRVLQLQEVAVRIGQDAQLLNDAASQAIEQPPHQSFFNPLPSLESAPPSEVLNMKPVPMNGDSLQASISPQINGDSLQASISPQINEDSLQARISAIVESGQEDEEMAG